jgi:phage protein D
MSGISTAMVIAMSVSAAASLGEGIYAAVSKPKAPTALSQAGNQSKQAEAQQAAALAQAQALQKRRGMASTTLTSPMGTTGSAQTQSATLGT